MSSLHEFPSLPAEDLQASICRENIMLRWLVLRNLRSKGKKRETSIDRYDNLTCFNTGLKWHRVLNRERPQGHFKAKF